MKKANYLTTRSSQGDTGKYPLSTETLDFIQQQITEMASIARIMMGDNCIIHLGENGRHGLIIVEGELMELRDTENIARPSYIVVKEEHQDVITDGITFYDARTIRYAEKTNQAGPSSLPIDNFPVAPSFAEVIQAVQSIQQTAIGSASKRIDDLKDYVDGEFNKTSLRLSQHDKEIEKLKSDKYDPGKKVEQLANNIADLQRRMAQLEDYVYHSGSFDNPNRRYPPY